MNYKKIYENLCESRKHRGITSESGYDIHHILPRSMGGSDEDTNLVKFTYKEHYIAHRLLYKFTKGSAKASMAFALKFMSRKNSRHYVEVNTYFKYTNKIPIKDVDGYFNLKPIEYHKNTYKYLPEGFEDLTCSYKTPDLKGKAYFFLLLCKVLSEKGFEGFCCLYRSSWKAIGLKFEKEGYLIPEMVKGGRKVFKFNRDKINSFDYSNAHPVTGVRDMKARKLFKSMYKLSFSKELSIYNSKNPLRSVFVEKSVEKGKYYILPLTSGWIPCDKALYTREEVIKFLETS